MNKLQCYSLLTQMVHIVTTVQGYSTALLFTVCTNTFESVELCLHQDWGRFQHMAYNYVTVIQYVQQT
jgi:hypothetical protein